MPMAEAPQLDMVTRLKVRQLRATHPRLLRHRTDEEIWRAAPPARPIASASACA